jgi:DNA-directed RNA polymerase subunit M/transcription elongation factor TFIIS
MGAENRDNIAILLSAFGVILNIPQAFGSEYPDILPNFLSWIPVEFILTWSPPLGLLTIGFGAGWYFKAWLDREESQTVSAIKGCIEKDGVAWKGIAKLEDGSITEMEMDRIPFCPKCQTRMTDDDNYIKSRSAFDSGTTIFFWKCPSCDKTEKRNNLDDKDDAGKILEKHLKKIVNSDEEDDVSLSKLTREIDGEITPEKVWEEYESVADDSSISTVCFH